MLFYDMFLTFGDEVEKIWKQPFTGATILWFLVRIFSATITFSFTHAIKNRYLTPLGYVVITVSVYRTCQAQRHTTLCLTFLHSRFPRSRLGLERL